MQEGGEIQARGCSGWRGEPAEAWRQGYSRVSEDASGEDGSEGGEAVSDEEESDFKFTPTVYQNSGKLREIGRRWGEKRRSE